MVARGPGDVGCAHCRLVGAAVACRICTRLVCDACGADWTTCEEPVGLSTRMGMSARLRDVDPSGRYGAVSRFAGQSRLIDLRRMAWVELPEPLPRFTPYSWAPPVLGDGVALESRWTWREGQPPMLTGIAVIPLAGGTSRRLTPPADLGAGWTSRIDGNLVWGKTREETVVIVDLEHDTWRSLSPLPGKVLQAAAFDARQSLLAAGTWGLVQLARVDDDRLIGLGRVEVTGDVRWVGVRGDTLAAIHDGTVLSVWRLHPDRSIGAQLVRRDHGALLGDADLSRDGEYVAFERSDRRVFVHALETDLTTSTEHSDTTCFVRFVGEEQLLVVGDNDNRVVVRPRTRTGYDVRIVEVPLARGRVPYEPPEP